MRTAWFVAGLALACLLGAAALDGDGRSESDSGIAAARPLEQPSRWAVLVDSLEDAMAEETTLMDSNGDVELVEVGGGDAATLEAGGQDLSQSESLALSPGSVRLAGKKPPVQHPGNKPTPHPLSPAVHQQKFAAFTKRNGKQYPTPAQAAAAFRQFSKNRVSIAAHNAKAASTLNPKPFSSAGPLAAHSSAEFKKKLAATKPPKARTGGKGRKPQRKSTTTKSNVVAKGGLPVKKAAKVPAAARASAGSARAFIEQESPGGAGGSVSSAGSAVGSAGSAVGSAGSAVGSAGSAVGWAGSRAGSAGSAVGSAGSAVGSAGSAVGSAGSAVGSAGSAVGSAGSAVSTAGSAVSSAGSAVSSAGSAVSSAGSAIGSAGSAVSTGNKLIVHETDPAASSTHLAVSNDERTKLVSISMDSRPLLTFSASISMSDIKDQGTCGACWAHVAVNSFEVALKNARLFRGPLSRQQILDCVRVKNQTAGCEGGTPMDAIDWMSKNSVALESDYPWTGKVGECVQPTQPRVGSDKYVGGGWTNPVTTCTSGICPPDLNKEMQLYKRLQQYHTAVIAYVDAGNWQHYSGGFFPPSQCSTTAEASNHVVEITGFGYENNIYFWKIRNSSVENNLLSRWGPKWGEGGYIKLPFGVNTCGLSNFVVHAKPFVVQKWSQADLDDYNNQHSSNGKH